MLPEKKNQIKENQRKKKTLKNVGYTMIDSFMWQDLFQFISLRAIYNSRMTIIFEWDYGIQVDKT